VRKVTGGKLSAECFRDLQRRRGSIGTFRHAMRT
jgi:hypothetical protein